MKSILSLILVICSSSLFAQELSSLYQIDNILQDSVKNILERRLQMYVATSGRAFVMESASGYIVSDVTLEKIDTFKYEVKDPNNSKRISGLFDVVSLLACLETSNVSLKSEIYLEKGLYQRDGIRIMDHNWQRGGYGTMTLKKGFENFSNIAIVKAVDMAFKDSSYYYRAIEKLGFAIEEDHAPLPFYATGYRKSTPLEILSFFNTISNNGIKVCPLFDKEEKASSVRIISKKMARTMKKTLECVVKEGVGGPSKVDFAKVAGYSSRVGDEDHEIYIDFCGFLNIKKKKYTILVMMTKEGFPSSGGVMAGGTFKDIANVLYDLSL